MQIRRLELKDFRIVADAVLEPSPKLNFFLGPNGAGKTALLEAIYVLARGRSFRTARISEVVRRGQEGFRVSAQIDHSKDGLVNTGVERGSGPLLVRYRGETVKRISEHAGRLPLVLLTPESQALVLGGPKERRHWLDWAMFHVEPDYLDNWRAYFQALRHRNALLKRRAGAGELEGWEEVMAGRAELMHQSRRRFVERLEAEFQGFASSTWDPLPSIRLEAGWDSAVSLKDTLRENRGIDDEAGFTRAGPHRADLIFATTGRKLESLFSRGECKLFISFLLLAQAEVMAELCGEPPVFLADDFAAELDDAAWAVLHGHISSRAWQAFLTGTRIPERVGAEVTVFHVEHGKLRKMVE